ncbi:MAG: hypothetical protein HXL28_09000 [Prevotellaceae bacterium]|nr:hypothetical protein [Prevotellaceae bacterium]
MDVGLIGSHLSFSIFRQPAAAGDVHSVLFFLARRETATQGASDFSRRPLPFCMSGRKRETECARKSTIFSQANKPCSFFFQSVGTSLRPSGAACRVYLTKRPEKALPQPVVYKKAHLQTEICPYEKTNNLLHFDFESTPLPQKWWTFARKSSKNAFRTASFAPLFSSALENQRMPPEGSQKNRIFAR